MAEIHMRKASISNKLNHKLQARAHAHSVCEENIKEF